MVDYWDIKKIIKLFLVNETQLSGKYLLLEKFLFPILSKVTIQIYKRILLESHESEILIKLILQLNLLTILIFLESKILLPSKLLNLLKRFFLLDFDGLAVNSHLFELLYYP